VYLRRCYRRKDGKRHAYWALVESFRSARGPRQRVVAYLGELDEQGRLGVQRAAQPAGQVTRRRPLRTGAAAPAAWLMALEGKRCRRWAFSQV